MEKIINLYAFCLPIFIVAFWLVVGYSTLNLLRMQRNTLQNLLLAPVVGFSVVLLLTFWLNRSGLPIERFSFPLVVGLLSFSILILYWRKAIFPFKRYLPFIGIFLLSLGLIGRPLLEFGFDWISYGNDDMVNYSLSALRFLQHGYFDLPDIEELVRGENYSLAYWFMHVPGMVRSGADITLALISGVFKKNPVEIFMPTILALNLILISATMSCIYQSRRWYYASLATGVLMSFSSLLTLGVLYQLIAQVAGSALLVASILLLMQSFSCYVKNFIKKQAILIAIVGSALGITYPEITPFLIISFAVYMAVYISKGGRISKNFYLCFIYALFFICIFLNYYLLNYFVFLFHQARDGFKEGNTGLFLFPNYLMPSGLSNLWGLSPLGVYFEKWNSVRILVGGILLIFAVYATIKLVRIKVTSMSILCLVMLGLGAVLFTRNSDFGLFKLAMYIQPALISTIIVYIFTYYKYPMRFIAVAVLASCSLIAQLYYVERSRALTAGGFTEIVFASNTKILKEFHQIISPLPAHSVIISADYNLSLLKLLALRAQGKRLVYDAPMFNNILNFGGVSSVDLIYKKTKAYFDLKKEDSFVKFNEFYINKFAQDVDLDKKKDIYLVSSLPSRGIINRLKYIDATNNNNFTLHKLSNIKNTLIFVDSKLGKIYYSNLLGFWNDQSNKSFFNQESDIYFKKYSFQAVGRYLLFKIINPSDSFRLSYSITNSLNGDKDNKLPLVEVVGMQRLPFSFTGRGSGHIFSPPISPQLINGSYYILIDMNKEGQYFPNNKKGLMNLYGKKIPIDSRAIASFARDISAISENEYERLHAPSIIYKFPQDLDNLNLEYSGIYEDGWISEDVFVKLQQPEGFSKFVLKGMLPRVDDNFQGSSLIAIVDGQKILHENIKPGDFNFEIPLVNKRFGRKKVELHFSHLQKLPGEDGRPVAAKVSVIGFQPA